MLDLVYRLRTEAHDEDISPGKSELLKAAADEIERLQEGLETAIRWLRRLENEYPGCLNVDAIDKHLQAALLGHN